MGTSPDTPNLLCFAEKELWPLLPNVPGTLTSDEKIRKQDLSVLTTDKVTAYQAKWHALFG